jgi:outer membrane lipoprotein SlyB
LHDHATAIIRMEIPSMPLRSAIFCALLLLSGCTTQSHPTAPKAQIAPPAGMPGIILAMRPVAAENPEPARILLSGLGTLGDSGGDSLAGGPGHARGDAPRDAQADSRLFEFIVRTQDGTTIAIVQPETHNLHPGEHVSIVRGAETRIEAPESD